MQRFVYIHLKNLRHLRAEKILALRKKHYLCTMKYGVNFGLFGCRRDIARVAGKVGGFTEGIFSGLCGALPVTKRNGGWQVAYNQINYSL